MLGKRGQESGVGFSFSQIALFVLVVIAILVGIVLSTDWGRKAIKTITGIGLIP